jgi:tellurite resistance protein
VFLIAADVADQGGISELEHKALAEIAEVLDVEKAVLLGA